MIRSESTMDADARVRRMELLISNLLRTGVVVSLLLMIAGTLILWLHHPGDALAPDHLRRLIRPGARFPHTGYSVLDGVRQLQGRAIILLGLMVLIATPILRVAVSIFAFRYQRDWAFVAITTTVLCLLLLSFVLGSAG